MKMDVDFHFVIEGEEVSNGMGGSITIPESNGSKFVAHKSPIKAEIMLKEYGIVSTSSLRLITKDAINLPLESLIITDLKLKYKILQVLNYKLNIFLIEVI